MQKPKPLSLLLILFLIASWSLAASPVLAADLFVAETGDDTGNNCQDAGSPCATVGHAITEASDTDTINITAGTYVENLTLNDLDLTLQGAGQTDTIIDGDDADTVIKVENMSDVTIAGLTIRNGTSINGGGISADMTSLVTINDSRVTENHATARGGGVFVDEGMLTINRSLIDKNTATDGCGGICAAGTVNISESTISENQATIMGAGGIALGPGTHSISDCVIRDNQIDAGSGAGLVVFGDLTMNNSLVHNNRSFGNNAVPLDGGGGIVIFSGATADIKNTTVSENQADFTGGGIGNAGTLMLDHVTIVNNVADADDLDGGDGGGIVNNDAIGTITLKNTIIADNIDASSDPDCFGTLTSAGFNLIEDASSAGCIFTPLASDITGEDPLIDALADNGGPTETHALLDGSPAIDNGTCTDIDDIDVTEDQRGSPRPVGDDCDIGAFETDVCGDSVLSSGEECDDGNTDDGDGCSSTCTVEEEKGGGCSLRATAGAHTFVSIWLVGFVLVLMGLRRYRV